MDDGERRKKSNDLFFTCGLIDYIARKTKNKRIIVVQKLGKEKLEKIYDLADVYHSYNIDQVAEEFIEEMGITEGEFDNAIKSLEVLLPRLQMQNEFISFVKHIDKLKFEVQKSKMIEEET